MGPGEDVGLGVGGRLGRVAGRGLDHDRVGQERRRGGRLGELLRELAVGQVQRAARARARRWRTPRRRWCRRCRARPRSRRAARRARPRPERMPATRSRTGAWRCEVPISAARSASAASASGRTFEGPQPKRPSAGFSSAGIWAASVAWVDIGLDRLLTAAGGLAPGPGLGWRRGCLGNPKVTEEKHVSDQLRSRFQPESESLDDLLPNPPGDPVADRRDSSGRCSSPSPTSSPGSRS